MRQPATRFIFNRHGVWAIYKFEIARSLRTLVQSLVTPVITTSLYFVVFGAAIGSRLSVAGGVSYGAFIVPGLIMLALVSPGQAALTRFSLSAAARSSGYAAKLAARR